jgi:hypothetical protein
MRVQGDHDMMYESNASARINPGDSTGIGNRKPELLTVDAVKQGPEFTWLVDDLLPANGFSILVGAPESYKTFFALDLAFSVAGGWPFHGKKVEKGSVVYISAEGRAGIPRRIRAWEQARGKEVGGVLRFCPMAVQIHIEKQVEQFVALIKDEMHPLPSLVIIDTLSRCFVGGQENDAMDMGQFVYGVDIIRDQLNAHVLALHHTGKKSESERGSSALFGAVDTDLFAKRESSSQLSDVTVSCAKQKDAEKFATMRLSPTVVDLPDGKDSLVLDSEFTGVLAVDRVILNRIRDAKAPMGYEDLRQAMKSSDKQLKPIGKTKLTNRIHTLVGWGYVWIEECGQGGKHILHLTGKNW